MVYEMRTDADLLNKLCDEAPLVTDRVTGRIVTLSRQTLAYWTGMSVQTISDYATGKHNIPADFWRRVLEHYVDPRILLLLLPDDGCFDVCVTDRATPADEPAFFKEALALQKAHNEQLTYILDILSDGRIDELDASTIHQYRDAHHGHRLRDAQLYRAINATFSAARQKAGAS